MTEEEEAKEREREREKKNRGMDNKKGQHEQKNVRIKKNGIQEWKGKEMTHERRDKRKRKREGGQTMRTETHRFSALQLTS